MSFIQSIGTVERETGLSKDILRVWERRYGFPQPLRNAVGERSYSSEQIAKLRLLKRLVDNGFRPGKTVNLSMQQLQELAQRLRTTGIKPTQALLFSDLIAKCLALCKSHHKEDLCRTLEKASMQIGLQRFVMEVAAPLSEAVGDAWAGGTLAVFEEHLFTEAMQTVLRNGIAKMELTGDNSSKRPHVLLTTLPSEQHGLGLLMAEAMFSMAGAKCISLGPGTPIPDIDAAARVLSVDVVALSFSSAMTASHVQQGLTELQQRLPNHMEIWAGGKNAALEKRPVPGVYVLDLQKIEPFVEAWRVRQANEN
jgi:methanogenic corrinoid protein MtbC1